MRKQLPLLIAAAIGVALVIPATYAVLRAYDVLVTAPGPNPATIVWSAHIAMSWRLWIGVYIAGMVAPLVYLAAKTDLPRTMRVLGTCVIVVAVMVGVQGLLMP
jgi:hypothetical protein